MDINERAAKVLLEIDEQLELAEQATPGPWKSFRAQASICVGDVREVTCIEDLEKGLHLEILSVDPVSNAEFIAESRTGYPLALQCLKTAIDGLLEIHRTQAGFSTRPHKDSAEALTTICNQWEETK